MRLNPWVRKIPWRRKWWPTSVFFPGKSQGQRRLVDYSPQGCKEWDVTEWVSTHACMDRDLVLHKPNLLPPVKQRKEANMCKHFLHRTSQGERNRRMCWEKPGCWGWPALPLLVRSDLSPVHTPRNDCLLSWPETWRSEWCTQPFWGQPGPMYPGYFSSLLSSLYFLLSAGSLVAFRFPILILSHSSLHQNHKCPRLTKAVFLVSAAGAMGLFGGE